MIINHKEVKSVISKSNLPIAGFTVNPYIGCAHACKYCYANFNKTKVQTLSHLHDPLSTLLIGKLSNNDEVKERNVKLLKSNFLF